MPKKNKKTFHIAATGEQPLMKLDLQMERWIYNRDVIGNVMNEAFVWCNKGYIEIYYSDQDVPAIVEDGKKLLDAKVAHKIINRIRKTEQEFWDIAKKFRNKFKNDLPKETLLELFEEFHNISRKMHAYFMTSREEPMSAIEEQLKEIVKKEYGDSFMEPYIALTTPTENDLLIQEKEDIIALCKNPTDEKIKAHALKYPLILFNVYSESDAFAVMRGRMTREEVKKLKEEIGSYESQKIILKKRQEDALRRLPEAAREYAWFIQQASVTRLLLKNCWGGTTYFLLPFFSFIAQMAAVSVRDIVLFATMAEMADIIRNGRWISSEELAKRQSAYLFYFNNPRTVLYSGDEARKMKEKLLGQDEFEKINEIKGTIANKGKARGKVKLIKVDSLVDIMKIAPGLTKEHILVAGMTNPTMMVLVRKVGAIVTDEGGMACHAAIISREFGLPCIVGCGIATKVLKDNDEIEVDADKGIVRIIERS